MGEEIPWPVGLHRGGRGQQVGSTGTSGPLGSGGREGELKHAGLLHEFGPAHGFGPPREKKPFLISHAFFINKEMKLLFGKYLGTSENYEIFLGGRFEYLAQLLY
jgi:hypothetical protein